MVRQKRSLTLHGHPTSVALEPEFWDVIDCAVTEQGLSFAGFLTRMDDERVFAGHRHSLASYLRVWAIKEVQKPKP